MSETTDAMALAEWPVAILAGGLATRMRPFTESIPKALLEVAGEPFVVHQLRLLRNAGFRRIVLCVGYLGERIEAFLRQLHDLDLDLSFVFDGVALRGTGGALKHALDHLGSQFVILYGDSYLPIPYHLVVAAFLRSGQPALMTVYKNDGRWDTSNVALEDGRLRSYNKHAPSPEMQYIDYGFSVVRADIFASFTGQEAFDLADLYVRLCTEKKLAAYEVQERFYEIGSPEGLRELDCYLRQTPYKIVS